MNDQTTRPRRLIPALLSVATAVVCLTSGPSIRAQSTPVPRESETDQPGSSPLEREAPVELPPFVVDASRDTGYYATNTLAGTRLRTDLKDVAAPISVFTPELLEDIAATNFQEAMLYSVNVENENEYARDDTEGESIASTTQTRVRGLSGSTQTRGYFTTNFRADTYNTERLTMARGPNSILFGLGSPAGVLDATPIRANPEKMSGQVSFRIDNHESIRSAVDFNVPLYRKVAAVRVAALDQKLRTFRDPDYDDERRYFAALTVKPFRHTTIRASYEEMENDRVRARTGLMQDRITDWIALGKPLYDHSTKMWTKDNGATWAALPELANFTNRGGIGVKDRVYLAGGQMGGGEVQALVWENLGISYDRLKSPRRTFSDDSIVPSDVNYHGLASQSALAGDIVTVVLEQKIIDNLYFEAAYNAESTSRDQHEALRGGLSAIEADVNFYLPYPVGQTTGPLVPNPNRGRYMIESEYLGYTQNVDLTTFRAMLSYSLDFAKTNRRWLGSHNFGVMYQNEVTDNFKIKRRLMNNGSYWITGGSDEYTPNNIKTRYYLDIPTLGGDANGVRFPGTFVPPPWDHVIGGVQGDGMPQQTRNDVAGKLFVMQNALLDRSLVLTFGYRKDEQKAYTSTFTQRDPVTREYITKGVGYDPDPSVQAGVTRTYGAVYHIPKWDWLTLTYNRSDAFNPQGDYFDWFGNPLPPGSGKGEDFGVNLALFDGKLQARINRFTNTSIDNVELDWYYEEPKWSVIGNMDASWGMVSVYAPRLGNPDDVNVVVPNDSIRATRDYKSKGYELELFYKPTRQLDLRFTLTHTEAVNLRIAPLLQEYIDARMPVWEKYFAYPAWHQWDKVLPSPDPNWQTNRNSTGYLLMGKSNGLPRVEDYKASEGSVTTRGRKWRSNLIANYNFEGRLKGVSLGGATRFRSADTIGYQGKPNPLMPSGPQVSDIQHPIRGSDEFLFDVWASYTRPFTLGSRRLNWSVQLNVRNLFSDGGIQPLSAYTDGSYTSYTRQEPRTILLTNTFKF